MKRFLSLVLLMVFAFSGCAKENGASETEGANGSGFVAPENYASVVLVTINPQFKLYLDAAGEVLAVEPVNDDAKSVAEKIETQKGDFETVMDHIVVAVKDGGFVRENAKVDFKVTEVKDKNVNTEAILNEAKDSADKSFKKINVTVEVTASVDEGAVTDPSVPGTSNPDNTEPTHTHEYSAATCTDAATCSCGATDGEALGHEYAKGVCTRCEAKDPDYKDYTSVTTKSCKWKFMFVSKEGTLYDGKLILNQTIPTVGAILGDKVEPDAPEAQDAITFEGNLYYCGRGTGTVPLKSVTEDGTTVTVTDTVDRKLVLTRIDENTLKVVSAVDEFGDAEGWPVIEGISKGLILKAE